MSGEMMDASVGAEVGSTEVAGELPQLEGSEQGQESGQEGHLSGAMEGLEGSQAAQENIETLAEQVQDAVDKGATEKEIKSLIKEFELKVNGKQVKAKIDLSDEEAVKRELQKAYAFNDVSQENAQIKKALSAKIASWKANPAQMFADLELDATDFAVNHLDREIEESKKTPEQKEAEAKQREVEMKLKRLEELEQREAKLRELLQKQQEEKELQAAEQSLIQEFTQAISKSSILEPNPETFAKVAQLIQQYTEYYENQGTPREITAEMVIPVLEKRERESVKKVAVKSEDAIIEALGEEGLKRLLAKYGQKPAQEAPAQVKPSIPSQVKPTSPAQVAKKEEPKRKESFEEVMQRLNRSGRSK